MRENFIKDVLFFIGLILVFPNPLWAEEDDMVFGLPRVEILFTDGEEALAQRKPMRIEREAVFIDEWGVWAMDEKEFFYEGFRHNVSLLGQDERVFAKYPPLFGQILISYEKHRFFSCEIDFHYGTTHSLLFDDKGSLLKKIPQDPEAVDCGKTDDDLLFWMRYGLIRDGKTLSVIVFIDTEGLEVHRTTIDKAGTVSFKFNGKKYSLDFPKPEFPG